MSREWGPYAQPMGGGRGRQFDKAEKVDQISKLFVVLLLTAPLFYLQRLVAGMNE